jgi:DNA polymerase III subunit gamma/tau
MVEDARQLRDSIRYAPLRSRFRIYIIDETHMLTRESFNTLLKTLEEPPPRAKFIFATTELHKVPDTIVSRCQLFEFKPLKSREIAKALEQVANREAIKVSIAALQLMARNSQGSMRDAESMLDQLASYSTEIKEEDVIRITGRTSLESARKLFTAVKAKSPKDVIDALDLVFKQGADPTVLTDQFIELTRGMLVAISSPLYKEILADFSPDELDFCSEFVQGVSTESLLYMIQLLFESRRRIRDGIPPQVVLEVAFVKMTKVADLLPITELLEQLKTGAKVSVQTDDIKSRWPAFIHEVKSKVNLLASTLLKESIIVRIENDTLTLGVPSEMAGKYNDERARVNIRAAEDLTPTFFGRRLSFVFQSPQGGTPDKKAPVTARSASEQVAIPTPDRVESSPSLKKVMEKFSGSKVIRKGE